MAGGRTRESHIHESDIRPADINQVEPDTDEANESADYSLTRVPASARLPWHTITIQSFGQAGNIGLLMLGISLGSSFGFSTAVTLLAAGLAIQAVTLIAMGAMGTREGIATTVLTRWTGLGRHGSALLGAVLATSVVGWFIVLNGTVAAGFSQVVGGPKWIWALVVGGAFTLVVMFGFGLMARTATVTAPAFLALTAYLVITEVGRKGFDAVISQQAFGSKTTVAAAITSVVAIWLTGIIVQPDMTRFARNTADVVKVTLFGTILGQFLICTAGVLLAAATKNADVVGIVTASSAILGVIFLITATANIQNLNLYVATLSLANAVDTWFGWRPKAALISLTVGLISASVSALGILSNLDQFLNLLGGLLPPVVGIMLAEYYVVRRWNAALERTRDSGMLPVETPGWVVSSLVVWVISSTIGFTVTDGIPVLNALLSAFVLAVISGGVMRALTRLTGIGGLSPAEQVFAIDIEVPDGARLPVGAFQINPESGGLVEVARPERGRHQNATELLVRLTNGAVDGRPPQVIGAIKIRTETNGPWPNKDGSPLVALRFDWARPDTGPARGPRAVAPPSAEETTAVAHEAISNSAPWRHARRGEPFTGGRLEPVGDSGPRRLPPGAPANGYGAQRPRPPATPPGGGGPGVDATASPAYRPVRQVDSWHGQPSQRFEPVRDSGPRPVPGAQPAPARTAGNRYVDPASNPRNPYVGPPPVDRQAPGLDDPPAARTSPNLFGWFGGNRDR